MAHSGKVHAQFELREKVQDDTTFFLDRSQVLFLNWKGVFLLLFCINVFLLLEYTLTLFNVLTQTVFWWKADSFYGNKILLRFLIEIAHTGDINLLLLTLLANFQMLLFGKGLLLYYFPIHIIYKLQINHVHRKATLTRAYSPHTPFFNPSIILTEILSNVRKQSSNYDSTAEPKHLYTFYTDST